jgi:hypothetical protein
MLYAETWAVTIVMFTAGVQPGLSATCPSKTVQKNQNIIGIITKRLEIENGTGHQMVLNHRG